MRKHLSLIVCILLLLASCQPEPYISISPANIDCPQEGGTFKIEVASNYVWKSINNSSDVVITPETGSKTDSATVVIAPNPNGSRRDLKVFFTTVNLKDYSVAPLVVSQDYTVPYIEVTASSKTISHRSDSIDIQIYSNYPWYSSASSSSIIISPASGETDIKEAKVYFPANKSETRTDYEVVFYCSNIDVTISDTLKITQSAPPVPVISITPQSKSIGAEGGEFQVTIASNYTWKAISDPELNLSQGIGENAAVITVTVPKNDTASGKSYTVDFLAGIGQSEAKTTLTIVQGGR